MELNNRYIDILLQPYQRFGVHLGLERIKRLLTDLGQPQQQIPIIHVAGTNGKGSVCAYLSSVLTAAGYTVGRYTSPHLVNWTERISVNEQPITIETLGGILQQIEQVIDPEAESPTQFEVITAAAWLYFVHQKVDIAVMEVGLGGRLDATNVCEQPLVTVITSISREHWQNLGPTLADIAREKAGILKQGCAAVIGNLPHEAKNVVLSRLEILNCPTVWVQPAVRIRENWAKYQDIEYSLPLLGDMQLLNSALALASLQILQQKGWSISTPAIQEGMGKTQWLGRIQWTKWQNHPLLVDGAHNPAAARVLRQYVDTLNHPITWIMGMLSTKDHQEIFQELLRAGDNLYLVPVPDHSSASPTMLADLAAKICPNLGYLQTFSELGISLDKAVKSNQTDDRERLIILCGSLYLVGYFLGKYAD
jgi:dihydrofolate synthase/folylpolyglutamate synthase